MLRFASSPTGDMHIGDLRVALFNHLIAQEKKEDLIIRIEDMDKDKNIKGKDEETLGLLGLFGIDYTQVIYQSESVRFHSAMALQLVHEKKAFSCFCSDDWLKKKYKEAELAKTAYLYDDACRNLPAELVIDNTSPFTIRIKKPDSNIVDSFVILNQDKAPTSDFATAVDDMLNNISLVICSEEHASSRVKQEHIRESLSYNEKVDYSYISTIEGAPSVKQLLEEGFLPEAISNYLISTGNKTPDEIFTLAQAREWFTLDALTKGSSVFDIDKLRHINTEHLKALDSKELSRYVGFADVEIGELARIYLEEAQTTKELKAKIAPIFSERVIPEVLTESVAKMKVVIVSAPYFDKYDDFKKYIIKESGLDEKNYSKALRILLTNAQYGPDLAEIYKYLKNYIGEIVK